MLLAAYRAIPRLYAITDASAAQDVANAALFLASDEASFITGVILPVDGVLTIRTPESAVRKSFRARWRNNIVSIRMPDAAADWRLDAIDPTGALARSVGLARQAMAADLVTRGDGWERSVRSVLLQHDRISIEVVVDRSLRYRERRGSRQIPIAWRSPTQIVAPWFVENCGFGPHRGFFGGLPTTCGLDHIGAPAGALFERLRESYADCVRCR